MAGLRDWRRRKAGERTREVVREETRVDLAEGDRERIAALEAEVEALVAAVRALGSRPAAVVTPPAKAPAPQIDERVRWILRALLAERDGAAGGDLHWHGGETPFEWRGVQMDCDTFLDAMRVALSKETTQ